MQAHEESEEHQKERENIQRLIAQTTASTAKASETAADNSAHSLHRTHSELLDAYQTMQRVIDRVEHQLGERADTGAKRTPKRIISDHADQARRTYSGPVVALALMLLEYNRVEWLHQSPDTNGAEQVRRKGFTNNQRKYLDDLQEAWEETNE